MDMHNMTICKKYLLQDLTNALLESEKISYFHGTLLLIGFSRNSCYNTESEPLDTRECACTGQHNLHVVWECASTVLGICMLHREQHLRGVDFHRLYIIHKLNHISNLKYAAKPIPEKNVKLLLEAKF